ncbi:MAG: adenylosuccinate lyase [Phycisphaerales bacterium]|nr:adenylosuccinate lyase [Phycisphaerales bacterium]
MKKSASARNRPRSNARAAARPAPAPPDQPPAGSGSITAVAPFEHVLATRYASAAMAQIWSRENRYACWRRIWLAAAQAQRAVGLPISAAQISALQRAADAAIDFRAVAAHERRTRHDVMAHIHALCDAAPAARPIVHLGMTSMDVVDNADLLLMRDALSLLVARIAAACREVADFAEAHADLPTLGFTHLQPAQLTTVGKRAALWLADVVEDLRRIATLRDNLRLRGLRGATGTQASFLKLLGSAAKVRRLEEDFAVRLGFTGCYPVCGQTYSRRVDSEIVHALSGLAASVHKCCNDVRLLAMLKEIEEPFEADQVGSSAMPYKRNPALCERATGLSRYLLSLAASPPMTHAAQMLERTLDDSSNKRLVIPDAFLAADAVAVLLRHIFRGMVVYPATIAAHIRAELPFIASEDILMAAVRAGGDRQELHERIRRHAQAAGQRVKQEARPNDLIERLQADAAFSRVRLGEVLSPSRFVGLAPGQVREFLKREVRPLLRRLSSDAPPAEVTV